MLGHREAQEITGNLSCVGRGDGAHKETLIIVKALCISLILTEPARTMVRRLYLRQTYYSWVNSAVWTLDRRLATTP